MYQNKKVVMLSTKQKTRLYLVNFNKTLKLDNTDDSYYHTGKHLYIISDEEIKPGDWYLETCIDIKVPKKAISVITDIWSRKIIATTDISLKLPNIPNKFITYFIKQYNLCNPVVDVYVKYVSGMNIEKAETELVLKITKDNIISIKSNPNNGLNILKVEIKDKNLSLLKYHLDKANEILTNLIKTT